MPPLPNPGASLDREPKGFWGQWGIKLGSFSEWGSKYKNVGEWGRKLFQNDPEAKGELLKLVAYLMRPDLIAGDVQKRFETGAATGDKTIRKSALSKEIRGGKEVETELDEKEKAEAEGLVEEVLIQEHVNDLIAVMNIFKAMPAKKNGFGMRSLQEIFAYTGVDKSTITVTTQEYMKAQFNLTPVPKNIVSALRTWLNNNDSADIADALKIPLKKAAQIKARSQQFLRRARQKMDDAFVSLNSGGTAWDDWKPVGTTTRPTPTGPGGPTGEPEADSTGTTAPAEETPDTNGEAKPPEAEGGPGREAEDTATPESEFSDEFKNAHKKDIEAMQAEGLKESNVDLILLNLITRFESQGVLDSVYLDGARAFLEENHPDALENFNETVSFLELAQSVIISGRKQIELIAEKVSAETETVDKAKRNFKKIILSVAKGVQLGHATAADAKYLLKGFCIVSPHNNLGDQDLMADFGKISENSGYDAVMAYNCKDGRMAISWEYLTAEDTNLIHSTAHEVYGHGVARAFVNKSVVSECKKNSAERKIKISPEVEAMINLARELMANGNREEFPLTRHLEQNVIKTPDDLRQEYNGLPAKQKKLYPDFASFYNARELSMIDEFSAEYLSLYYECNGSPEQFVFKVLEASDPIYIERFFGAPAIQVEAYLREIDPKTGQPLREDLETPPFAEKAGRFLGFLKTVYGFSGSIAKGSKGQIEALVTKANLAEEEKLAADDFSNERANGKEDMYAAMAGPFGAFLSELTGANLTPSSMKKK